MNLVKFEPDKQLLQTHVSQSFIFIFLFQILDQVWPFIGDYVRDLLMTSVQEKIQSSHSQAASFKFLKIDLGDIVSACKYTKNVYIVKRKLEE